MLSRSVAAPSYTDKTRLPGWRIAKNAALTENAGLPPEWLNPTRERPTHPSKSMVSRKAQNAAIARKSSSSALFLDVGRQSRQPLEELPVSRRAAKRSSSLEPPSALRYSPASAGRTVFSPVSVRSTIPAAALAAKEKLPFCQANQRPGFRKVRIVRKLVKSGGAACFPPSPPSTGERGERRANRAAPAPCGAGRLVRGWAPPFQG
jgi:hypothetical protein